MRKSTGTGTQPLHVAPIEAGPPVVDAAGSLFTQRRLASSAYAKPTLSARAFYCLLLLTGTACAVAVEDDPETELLGIAQSAVVSDNGAVLSNGLTLPNGFKLSNGASLTNGFNLSNGVGGGLANGINIPNGTIKPQSGSDLEKWIDSDPNDNKRILKYMIQCALPTTKSVVLTYRGCSETYSGLLNLAPGWATSTGQMTTTEQEKVSACLLVRVNANGAVRQINLVGPSSFGPGWNTRTSTDHTNFPTLEAAFAGNLFVYPPKVFVCGAGPFSSFENDVSLTNPGKPTMFNARVCPGTGTVSSLWNNGTAQTGPQWEALGTCGGLISFDTNCGSITTNCAQANAYSSGSSVDPYYNACWDANNKRTWNYVLTSYITRYSFGHACSGNWECVSGLCQFDYWNYSGRTGPFCN